MQTERIAYVQVIKKQRSYFSLNNGPCWVIKQPNLV